MSDTIKIARHPGPFVGPDAELARAAAMAVIPWYGDDDETTHQRILKDGVWNDHVAVQAALAAIHHLKAAHDRRVTELLEANTREVERRRKAEEALSSIEADASMLEAAISARDPVRELMIRAGDIRRLAQRAMA